MLIVVYGSFIESFRLFKECAMKKFFSLATVCMFLQTTALMAASGLASYNRYDVTFKYGKTQENVTCIQDAKDEKQWYYVSNKPRLAESKNGDPMMMLVSWQKNSKANVKTDDAEDIERWLDGEDADDSDGGSDDSESLPDDNISQYSNGDDDPADGD